MGELSEKSAGGRASAYGERAICTLRLLTDGDLHEGRKIFLTFEPERSSVNDDLRVSSRREYTDAVLDEVVAEINRATKAALSGSFMIEVMKLARPDLYPSIAYLDDVPTLRTTFNHDEHVFEDDEFHEPEPTSRLGVMAESPLIDDGDETLINDLFSRLLSQWNSQDRTRDGLSQGERLRRVFVNRQLGVPNKPLANSLGVEEQYISPLERKAFRLFAEVINDYCNAHSIEDSTAIALTIRLKDRVLSSSRSMIVKESK